MGQLGQGHYHRIMSPKQIDYFNKHKLVISQVGVTAYGSVALDMNGKVWWFGSNGTI
jgi:alpha-tubulin suppressor-like RCC1 family protein